MKTGKKTKGRPASGGNTARVHAVKISPVYADGSPAWQADAVMDSGLLEQASKLDAGVRRALARVYIRWSRQLMESADLMDRQIVGLN